MFMVKEPFILSLRRRATGTTTFTAKTEPWKHGDVVVIDQVSVSISAHKTKVVHIGVIRDEFALYYETLSISENDQFFCTKSPVVVNSDYRIIVKCVTPTAGVLYTVNIMGHIERYCKD